MNIIIIIIIAYIFFDNFDTFYDKTNKLRNEYAELRKSNVKKCALIRTALVKIYL